MSEKKHAKSSWTGKSSESKKPWGREICWSSFLSIHGKILFINSGERTSLKYNSLKSETLYILSGKASALLGSEVTLSDPVQYPFKKVDLEPGACVNIQSGCPYRITAITDCVIVEIGNNRGDKPVRIEDDYGRI